LGSHPDLSSHVITVQRASASPSAGARHTRVPSTPSTPRPCPKQESQVVHGHAPSNRARWLVAMPQARSQVARGHAPSKRARWLMAMPQARSQVARGHAPSKGARWPLAPVHTRPHPALLLNAMRSIKPHRPRTRSRTRAPAALGS